NQLLGAASPVTCVLGCLTQSRRGLNVGERTDDHGGENIVTGSLSRTSRRTAASVRSRFLSLATKQDSRSDQSPGSFATTVFPSSELAHHAALRCRIGSRLLPNST